MAALARGKRGPLPFGLAREAGWWARQDSNLRQHRYERRVLTAELRALGSQLMAERRSRSNGFAAAARKRHPLPRKRKAWMAGTSPLLSGKASSVVQLGRNAPFSRHARACREH